jgi:hypothetical protein
VGVLSSPITDVAQCAVLKVDPTPEVALELLVTLLLESVAKLIWFGLWQ